MSHHNDICIHCHLDKFTTACRCYDTRCITCGEYECTEGCTQKRRDEIVVELGRIELTREKLTCELRNLK